ncbi:MAG: M1 family aminopeptidase [Oxalobacteraceae bacterium]|nr:M1 family aminopeptidase [Oxalobacteraceae bacterium]
MKPRRRSPAPVAWWALLALFALLLQGTARAALPQLELQLELDPGRRRLNAVALLAPAAAKFNFTLHETLEVRAAALDGQRVKVVAAGRDGALRHWRVALPVTAGTLRLEYGGTLPALDRSLDQHDVLRSLSPMAASEGSFLPAGGAWYPQPAARFTYKVSVSLPAGQRALVPGRLLSEQLPTDASGRYRASFEFLQPADGIDLMAGPWLVREQSMPRAGGGPVRLRTYFTPELDAIAGLADGYLDDTRRYLELYSAQIGAYPFSEFSVVASPLPTGFGMPTLTYISAEVLKLPFIRASSLGHEVLHNWWGNGVYVDYASGNWCEGLTTFMADYAYKERESDEAARQMRLGWLRDFAAVPAASRQPLTAFRSRIHGAAAALGYGKSAMLFVMLRDTIGADAFRRGLRVFWDRHRFQSASWDDLRRAFEQAAGRPLEPFFAQWLNRADAPAMKIASASAKSQGGKTRLTLALEQDAPAYALRLPLEILYAGRSETRWIDSRREHDEVTLAVDAVPEAVRLDPDLRVWRQLERAQLPPILRQWIVAAAPRLLIASPATDVREAVDAVARRLFETAPQTIAPDQLKQGSEPVLLAGLHADVDAALAGAGLPPRPANLAANRSGAQVWTLQRTTGAPLAVVSATDANALRALLRPLPHYGAQSWLRFDGSRLLARGVWPAPASLIPVQFSQ